jgi:hypothetical protein
MNVLPVGSGRRGWIPAAALGGARSFGREDSATVIVVGQAGVGLWRDGEMSRRCSGGRVQPRVEPWLLRFAQDDSEAAQQDYGWGALPTAYRSPLTAHRSVRTTLSSRLRMAGSHAAAPIFTSTT